MNVTKLASATALALLLMTGAAAAQTYNTTGTNTTGTSGTGSTSGTTNTSSSTVGTPNTGAGGDLATNAIALMTTGAVALGGAALLARRRMA